MTHPGPDSHDVPEISDDVREYGKLYAFTREATIVDHMS
jgi:hypothetical protein